MQGKKFLLIIGLILVIAIGIFLTQSTEPVKKQFSINYGTLNATKIIEIGDKKTETLFLANAEGFVVISAIPKSIADSASEISIEHNGVKEIWKDDPIIAFTANSKDLKIKLEYPKNSEASSINAILPISFVGSLSISQKQQLINELENLALLNANDEAANEIENKLAENLTKAFTQQANLKENPREKTVFFDAEPDLFENILGAISETGEWASQNSARLQLPIEGGDSDIVLQISFTETEKSQEKNELEDLRESFPLLEEKNPIVLTYSEEHPKAAVSAFFVKPESKDPLYRDEYLGLDQEVSKTKPVASMTLLPSAKQFENYLQIRVEEQEFSPYVFKLTVNLDLTNFKLNYQGTGELMSMPDFFEGTILLDYQGTGELMSTHELPFKAYFNGCKTSELDELISEHEVLLRRIDCKNNAIAMKRLVFDSTNVEYYTNENFYYSGFWNEVEDHNRDFVQKINSDIIEIYGKTLIDFNKLNQITNNNYQKENGLQVKRLEEWKSHYEFRFDSFGDNKRKERIELLKEWLALEKEVGVYSALPGEEKNKIDVNALDEALGKEFNEKYGYNNILITKLTQLKFDLEAQLELLGEEEFKSILFGDPDKHYIETVSTRNEIQGIEQIIEKLRNGESLIQIHLDNLNEYRGLVAGKREITPINVEHYPNPEEHERMLDKYYDFERKIQATELMRSAFENKQVKDELRLRMYLVNKDFVTNLDQAEVFMNQVQTIELALYDIGKTKALFKGKIEELEDSWSVGIFRLIFRKSSIEDLTEEIENLEEEQQGLKEILIELEKGKSITQIHVSQQSAMNNPIIVAEIEKDKYFKEMKETSSELPNEETLASLNNAQKAEHYRKITETRRTLKIVQMKGAFGNAERLENLGKKHDVQALLHRALEEYIQIEVACCPDCSRKKELNQASFCFEASTGKDFGVEAYEKSESIGSRWFSSLYWSNLRTVIHGLTSPKAIITFGLIGGTIKLVLVAKNASKLASMSAFISRTTSQTAKPVALLTQSRNAKILSSVKKIIFYDVNPINYLFPRLSSQALTKAATEKLGKAIFKYRYGGLQGFSSVRGAQSAGTLRVLQTDELFAGTTGGKTASIKIGEQTFRVTEGETTLLYQNGRTAIVVSKQSPNAVKELHAATRNMPRAMSYLEREGLATLQQVDDAEALAGIFRDASQRIGSGVIDVEAAVFTKAEALQYFSGLEAAVPGTQVALSLARPFNSISARGLSFETALANATGYSAVSAMAFSPAPTAAFNGIVVISSGETVAFDYAANSINLGEDTLGGEYLRHSFDGATPATAKEGVAALVRRELSHSWFSNLPEKAQKEIVDVFRKAERLNMSYSLLNVNAFADDPHEISASVVTSDGISETIHTHGMQQKPYRYRPIDTIETKIEHGFVDKIVDYRVGQIDTTSVVDDYLANVKMGDVAPAAEEIGPNLPYIHEFLPDEVKGLLTKYGFFELDSQAEEILATVQSNLQVRTGSASSIPSQTFRTVINPTRTEIAFAARGRGEFVSTPRPDLVSVNTDAGQISEIVIGSPATNWRSLPATIVDAGQLSGGGFIVGGPESASGGMAIARKSQHVNLNDGLSITEVGQPRVELSDVDAVLIEMGQSPGLMAGSINEKMLGRAVSGRFAPIELSPGADSRITEIISDFRTEYADAVQRNGRLGMGAGLAQGRATKALTQELQKSSIYRDTESVQKKATELLKVFSQDESARLAIVPLDGGTVWYASDGTTIGTDWISSNIVLGEGPGLAEYQAGFSVDAEGKTFIDTKTDSMGDVIVTVNGQQLGKDVSSGVELQPGDLIGFGSNDTSYYQEYRVIEAQRFTLETEGGEIFEIGPNDRTVRVGRNDPDSYTANLINLPDEGVSRRHVYIQYNSWENRLVVEDRGSLKGTMVNGQKILPNRKVPLKKGDEITINGAAPHTIKVVNVQGAAQSGAPALSDDALLEGYIRSVPEIKLAGYERARVKLMLSDTFNNLHPHLCGFKGCFTPNYGEVGEIHIPIDRHVDSVTGTIDLQSLDTTVAHELKGHAAFLYGDAEGIESLISSFLNRPDWLQIRAEIFYNWPTQKTLGLPPEKNLEEAIAKYMSYQVRPSSSSRAMSFIDEIIAPGVKPYEDVLEQGARNFISGRSDLIRLPGRLSGSAHVLDRQAASGSAQVNFDCSSPCNWSTNGIRVQVVEVQGSILIEGDFGKGTMENVEVISYDLYELDAISFSGLSEGEINVARNGMQAQKTVLTIQDLAGTGTQQIIVYIPQGTTQVENMIIFENPAAREVISEDAIRQAIVLQGFDLSEHQGIIVREVSPIDLTEGSIAIREADGFLWVEYTDASALSQNTVVLQKSGAISTSNLKQSFEAHVENLQERFLNKEIGYEEVAELHGEFLENQVLVPLYKDTLQELDLVGAESDFGLVGYGSLPQGRTTPGTDLDFLVLPIGQYEGALNEAKQIEAVMKRKIKEVGIESDTCETINNCPDVLFDAKIIEGPPAASSKLETIKQNLSQNTTALQSINTLGGGRIPQSAKLIDVKMDGIRRLQRLHLKWKIRKYNDPNLKAKFGTQQVNFKESFREIHSEGIITIEEYEQLVSEYDYLHEVKNYIDIYNAGLEEASVIGGRENFLASIYPEFSSTAAWEADILTRLNNLDELIISIEARL